MNTICICGEDESRDWCFASGKIVLGGDDSHTSGVGLLDVNRGHFFNASF